MTTKFCSKCSTHKLFSEFNKLTKAKDGLQIHCKSCKSAYQQNNKNRNAVVKKYRDANREVCIQRTMASVAKKPEYYNGKAREWAHANPDRVVEIRRKSYVANSAAVIERAQRGAGVLRGARNVTQAEQAEIDGMYLFCQIFPGFEVDHILPLRGDEVSGLHVPSNLQVLTVFANRSKGRKFLDCYRDGFGDERN